MMLKQRFTQWFVRTIRSLYWKYGVSGDPDMPVRVSLPPAAPVILAEMAQMENAEVAVFNGSELIYAGTDPQGAKAYREQCRVRGMQANVWVNRH